MIHSKDESQWYDKDGTPYTGKKKGETVKCISENEYLKTKIIELEAKVVADEKVHLYFYLIILLLMFLAHYSFLITGKITESK